MMFSMLALLTAAILNKIDAHWMFWMWFIFLCIAQFLIDLADTLRGKK